MRLHVIVNALIKKHVQVKNAKLPQVKQVNFLFLPSVQGEIHRKERTGSSRKQSRSFPARNNRRSDDTSEMTDTELAQIQCRQDTKIRTIHKGPTHVFAAKRYQITAVIILIFEFVQGPYKVATVLWLGTDCTKKQRIETFGRKRHGN